VSRMIARRLIAGLLLAFAAVSVAALVYLEVRPPRAAETGKVHGPANGVSVYYFHRMTRCASCRKIEAVSKQAIERGFPQALREGRLEWHVANYETPEYEPIGKKYGLFTSTLVAIEFRDGQEVRAKSLDETWDHLDDDAGLVAYVQKGVGELLGEGAGTAAEAAGSTGFLLALATALWLGVLTSISPCPMAANIAAISFIGRRVGSPRQVLFSGLLYTLGRMLAYVVLAALIVGGLLYKAEVSDVLSKYLNRVLGPILIVVGVVLLGLVTVTLRGFAPGEKTQQRVERMGVWGAGVLGILFALAFCPISAGLFFVSLVGLALAHQSRALLPSAYGLGTALPVVVFAFVIALSAQSLGKVFNRLSQFEWWARRATGAVFLLVGGYFCLTYIYGAL